MGVLIFCMVKLEQSMVPNSTSLLSSIVLKQLCSGSSYYFDTLHFTIPSLNSNIVYCLIVN